MTLTLPEAGISGETLDLCANKRPGSRVRAVMRAVRSLYFLINANLLMKAVISAVRRHSLGNLMP
jgi:hypothetical protein